MLPREDGSRWIVAMPNRGEDAQLMAAARDALPGLFERAARWRR